MTIDDVLISFGLKKLPKPTPIKRKAKGFALCIGVNKVDPNHYAGWSGPLVACENDARHMSHMLTVKGFETTILLTRNATRANVFRILGQLAGMAEPGDIVVVTNSSHGSQITDYDGDELDSADETICMWDGQILDDELEAAWAMFAPAVRIMFVSDSCHSGTMARLFGGSTAVMHQPGSKATPTDVAQLTEQQNLDMYKALARSPALKGRDAIRASVLSFGGCQDNQTSMDGPVNGAFTGALLQVLRDYPQDSLGRVITRVRRALPADQTPSYVYAGPRLALFEKAVAFSI